MFLRTRDIPLEDSLPDMVLGFDKPYPTTP